ncbi:sensor histidine kinase [Glaciecola petra]|uniref:histidine kinase n=1 Tax=Glaciecola petra TaxID=3075602 RepID=A0ABU2ZUJ4_9ALTE|nr:ATP-binding protein [Aestuariibacter sp. P117]MDT0596312.1 ATP-binding protein [Aestuariibacter sp. P117]
MKNKFAQTKVAFEDKLVHIALFGCLLPTILSITFILLSDMSVYLKVLLIFLLLVVVAYAAFTIHQQVIFQLRTSTNLVESMTLGDYSLRANNKQIKGALSDFNKLLNNLAERLAQQNLITREQQILLGKVTSQIDVAIVAVDHNNNISLMNPAAERLFNKKFSELEAWPIENLGLQNVIKQATSKVTEFEINQSQRKVYVRADTYFELGKQQHLIFITDIQNLLRDEERLAWQRLLRVLSHEINNSLTPIASISETLSHILHVQTKSTPDNDKSRSIDTDNYQLLAEGLQVITERAHSLNRFIQDYQQLTKLPAPVKTVFAIRPFILQICQLFETTQVHLLSDDIDVFADREQLQQVFVNLLKNAEEANLANKKNKEKAESSEVAIVWFVEHAMVHVHVYDKGNGIKNHENLFVPFYTTKPKGSGIGLSLSQQIALNHSGDLSLTNVHEGDSLLKIMPDFRGAKATFIIPIATHDLVNEKR